MSMEVHWSTATVPQQEQARYGNEPGWLDAMRGTALRSLADRILRDRALYRRIDPPKDDLQTPFKHQWSIGLESNLDDIAAREAQIEQGRKAGLAEAAAIVNAAGERYSKLDGGCAGVIASALFDAASAIQKS